MLDTQIFLWTAVDAQKLRSHIQTAIRDAEMIYLSAGSIWEIVIKESKGRLDLPLSSASYVPTACSKMGATFLPIRAEHAFIVRDLPPHHKDPFDRIIVAQALIEGLTLVTADAKLLNYPVTTLDAR